MTLVVGGRSLSLVGLFTHLIVGGVVTVTNIVILHIVLQKVSALVEQTEGNDRLHNTDTLSTKDAAQSKGGHIVEHFLDGFRDRVRLALDGGRLHNDFETRQGVGDDDVNGRHDGRGYQARGRTTERRLVTQFFLDILLQAGLSDQAKKSRSQGMTHKRNGTTKEWSKAGTGGLFQNFPNGLDGTGLTKVGTLLLFNHADGVDKGGAENGSGRGGGEAWILSFAEKEGKA